MNKFLAVLLILVCSCMKDNLPPNAIARAFPATADSTIQMEFNATGSFDNSTYLKGLIFSWDFNMDGAWDVIDSQEPITLYQFKSSGHYQPVLKVTDQAGLSAYDTLLVYIKPANLYVGSLYDERDGKTYKTVRINNKWWMAENLSIGDALNSQNEQTDNNRIEKYFFYDDSANFASLGGVYRWEEAIDYTLSQRGICPGGWHIPSSEEWKELLNNIDPWYAWQYYGLKGLSKLNIHEGVSARRENETILWYPDSIDHWASDYYQLAFLREQAPYVLRYSSKWGSIGIRYIRPLYDESDEIFLMSSNYATIRCIKDE